jgi:hypothetical protein
MPFSFKLTSKFSSTKWNDQGKRPRADTAQVDEVVANFNAMTNKDKIMGGEDNNNIINNNKRNQDHLLAIETPEEICAIVDASPEQEQREMIQNIAARILAMQHMEDVSLDVQHEQEIPGSTTTRASFIGSRIPAISFVKYVERLVHNINRWAHEKPGMDSVGVQSGVFAIEYLERSCTDITPRSIHRCFLAAFLLGIKYSFDYYLSNTYWAGVGGIRLPELNTLEMDFCCQLNWDFSVAPEVFQAQFDKTRMFYV